MKERIAFVGAGRVGISLAAYFASEGLNVVSIYARSKGSCEKAALFIEKSKITREITGLKEPDVIFITTKDDAIKKVAEKLHELYPEAHLVHTSGAHSSRILPGKRRASLHPMQSFADPQKAIEGIKETLFTLEGTKETVKLCERLLNRLKLKYAVINEKDKVLYHIAACIASNYLVTLFAKALECIQKSGVEKELGTEGLLNLSFGTLKNIREKGIPHALTGPIARGDKETIKLHLKALKEHPELFRFYTFLGKETAKMIDKDTILKIFEGEKNEKGEMAGR